MSTTHDLLVRVRLTDEQCHGLSHITDQDVVENVELARPWIEGAISEALQQVEVIYRSHLRNSRRAMGSGA